MIGLLEIIACAQANSYEIVLALVGQPSHQLLLSLSTWRYPTNVMLLLLFGHHNWLTLQSLQYFQYCWLIPEYLVLFLKSADYISAIQP